MKRASVFSYDEQQQTLRSGLRILARRIARIHMQRQSLEDQAEAVDKGKNRTALRTCC